MKLKIFIFFCLSFVLISCGSWDEEDSWATLINYTWSGFSMSLPPNWDIIKNTDSILPKPSFWKIELAVKSSSESSDKFFNNLLILRWKIEWQVSSKDYSVENNIWSKKGYTIYREISGEDFTFNDLEASKLFIFEAKYNLWTPSLKYLQTARVCSENNAYLITIALSQSISDYTKYKDLIKDFKCD